MRCGKQGRRSIRQGKPLKGLWPLRQMKQQEQRPWHRSDCAIGWPPLIGKRRAGREQQRRRTACCWWTV
ncbi:hypothetical protein RE628_20665 [Paenibacillus sp. D2_2]|uniref:hypothetical protein n=1 Tax=Paenibacillus sp. D2_2 TaxID=3073092 RepID=UPI0028166538|nr:hypothetical protein [Paenibacillus sp. D2_2]WMT39773.1 hypothetical protein RE628_20665 [Paenibacillus sp. D2_2]